MKVGYSATLWDNGRSGIGTYIAEQIALLYRRTDLEVKVFEFGGRLLPRGEFPRTSGTQQGVSKSLRPLKDIWWHRRELGEVARRERLDLVHVPCIRRLPARLPCPAVAAIHDVGPMRLGAKYGLLRRIFHRQILPRWVGGIDAVVTPSSSTKTDLEEFYHVPPEKLHLVPLGVDHARHTVGDIGESTALVRDKYKVRPPYFLYVSRIEHPAKNHVRLIEAFGRFRESCGFPYQLVLAGARWNGFEHVESAAARMRESGDVLFADFVPTEHLPHFVRGATALIFPSLFEGFGLPVVEAMACGTPVACSRCSSLTEIVSGYGLLFDPYRVDEIAGAMRDLAMDEDLRRRLREAGLKRAQSFSWERCVEETVGVWRQVLEKRAG